MFKKILSILLIGLLVMSSIGSACAQSEYYAFNCKLGDEFTTNDVMDAIKTVNPDPTWVFKFEINDALVGCRLVHILHPDIGHSGSHVFTGVKVGSKWLTLNNGLTSDDYIQITVDPR
jgi:hypothetical protein